MRLILVRHFRTQSNEARRIMGLPTRRIQEELGYRDGEEMIHRDNLVLC